MFAYVYYSFFDFRLDEKRFFVLIIPPVMRIFFLIRFKLQHVFRVKRHRCEAQLDLYCRRNCNLLFPTDFMFAITGTTLDNSTTVRYECPKCSRTYKWRSSLKSHLQNECGKEPRCLCPHCPYRCKVRSNLLKHVRNYHKPPTSVVQNSVFEDPKVAHP